MRLFYSLSQEYPRKIFNSPAAWERIKDNLCGRVALSGYKWDCLSCQQQAIRSLSWSTEPPQAAVAVQLEAELTSGQQYYQPLCQTEHCSLLPDNSVSIRKLYSIFKNTLDKAILHLKFLKGPVKNTQCHCVAIKLHGSFTSPTFIYTGLNKLSLIKNSYNFIYRWTCYPSPHPLLTDSTSPFQSHIPKSWSPLCLKKADHWKACKAVKKLRLEQVSTSLILAPTWIWDACRSMVIIWSAPATDSMFATSLAEIGARL